MQELVLGQPICEMDSASTDLERDKLRHVSEFEGTEEVRNHQVGKRGVPIYYRGVTSAYPSGEPFKRFS